MISSQDQPSDKDTLIAVALLILGAMAVAVMPNTAKLTLESGANTETTVLIRVLTALPLLALYMMARGISFRIPVHLFRLMMTASLSSAGMYYSFMFAIQYIDISQAILILFTHPFLIAFYYHATGQSLMTASRVFWSIAAFSGLTLALAVEISTISLTGVALASAASLFVTVMVISMVKASNATSGVVTNFHMTFWTLVLTLLFLSTAGTLQWPETTLGWISGAGNGISYIAAYMTFLGAAKLIGASRASVLTFMEPVATILLASYLFGEYLNPLQWGGVALVAAGLLFMEIPRGFWSKRRNRSGRG